jgi:hypothetical protein
MKIEDFEQLISDHVYAALRYENSQTCDREIYLRQEDAVFDTKAKLLDAIEALLEKSNG